MIAGIEHTKEGWELNGVTDEFAVTFDHLMYWVFDMAKRGYEFDACLEAYGAPFDPSDSRISCTSNCMPVMRS